MCVCVEEACVCAEVACVCAEVACVCAEVITSSKPPVCIYSSDRLNPDVARGEGPYGGLCMIDRTLRPQRHSAQPAAAYQAV